MALIDVIKSDPSSEGMFVWKYPNESIKFGSQLIVGEGQVERHWILSNQVLIHYLQAIFPY